MVCCDTKLCLQNSKFDPTAKAMSPKALGMTASLVPGTLGFFKGFAMCALCPVFAYPATFLTWNRIGCLAIARHFSLLRGIGNIRQTQPSDISTNNSARGHLRTSQERAEL